MLLQMALFHSFLWLSNIPLCIYILHLLYPFICRWTFRLLLCLGYCKQCHHEHSVACFFSVFNSFLFFFNFYLFYFWLRWAFIAAWSFSSCGELGLLFVAVCGLHIAVASLVAEHGLQAHGLQQLQHAGSVVVACGLQSTGSVDVAHGLSCSIACRIFLARAQTHVPCISRQILNHCTTREARMYLL